MLSPKMPHLEHGRISHRGFADQVTSDSREAPLRPGT